MSRGVGASGTKNGNPFVDLSNSFYAIRTVFYNPFTKAECTLPPHHLMLVGAAYRSVMLTSPVSDLATGVAVVQGLKADYEAWATAHNEMAFVLMLLPEEGPERAAYMSNREAYIDLEKLEWATPKLTAPETRPLLRIPFWSTDRKVVAGGGIADLPTGGGANFATDGRLRVAEMQVQNDVANPWRLILDDKWLRARIRFFFMNLGQTKQEVTPPGLLVEACHGLSGTRVGAASATQVGDGTVEILIASNSWDQVNFTFTKPIGYNIDMTMASPASPTTPDLRMVKQPSGDGSRYYFVPNRWHSWHTMGAAAATLTPGVRTDWQDLRAQLIANSTQVAELAFHWDDVVLYGKTGTATISANTPCTLLDRKLSIIEPQTTTVPPRPDLTDLTKRSLPQATLQGPAIPAEVLFDPTKPTQDQTRLICIQGSLYDLGPKRMRGTPFKHRRIGLRAAVIDDHPIGNYANGCSHIYDAGMPLGHYEARLIRVPQFTDGAGMVVKGHLLLFVPVRVGPHASMAPAATDSATTVTAKTAEETAAKRDIPTILSLAMERWSQGHPGLSRTNPGGGSKDYRITNPAATGEGFRIRAYFPITSAGNHLFDIQYAHDYFDPLNPGPPPNDRPARSGCTGSTMVYYANGIAADTSTSGVTSEDSDGVKYAWHTLAHEFGHVMGLPDDYAENFSPIDIDTTFAGQGLDRLRLPAFNTAHNLGRTPPINYNTYPFGGTTLRPYFYDDKSLMTFNELPRLRHFWHHGRSFNDLSGTTTHRLRHHTFDTAGMNFLTYNELCPYKPFATRAAAGALHSDILVYPVGEDEGTTEGMFQPGGVAGAGTTTLAAGSRFDGYAVVWMRFEFAFDSAISNADRWSTMFSFHSTLFDVACNPYVRFRLAGGTKMTRIAIIMAPAYAYIDNMAAPVDAQTHLRLNIQNAAVNPDPFLTNVAGNSVTLGRIQLSVWCVTRIALGMTPFFTTPGGPSRASHPLVSGDFNPVARQVDALLGDAAGTRTVSPV